MKSATLELMSVVKQAVEFVWDQGNISKNWDKHRVTANEAEEVFFDLEKREFGDQKHSSLESRRIVVGKTKNGRILYVAYTMRGTKIRVISARDVNKRERKLI